MRKFDGNQDIGLEAFQESQEEMGYMKGQGGFNKQRGFNQNYRNHPNFFYRNPNDKAHKTKSTFNKNYKDMVSNYNKKISTTKICN